MKSKQEKGKQYNVTSFVESASESDERNDDVFEQDEDEVMEPCEEE